MAAKKATKQLKQGKKLARTKNLSYVKFNLTN